MNGAGALGVRRQTAFLLRIEWLSDENMFDMTDYFVLLISWWFWHLWPLRLIWTTCYIIWHDWFLRMAIMSHHMPGYLISTARSLAPCTTSKCSLNLNMKSFPVPSLWFLSNRLFGVGIGTLVQYRQFNSIWYHLISYITLDELWDSILYLLIVESWGDQC